MNLLNTKQAMKHLGIKSEATFKTYRQKGYILKPHLVSSAGNVYRDIDLDRAKKPIAKYISFVKVYGRLHRPKPIEFGGKQALFNQFLINHKRAIT